MCPVKTEASQAIYWAFCRINGRLDMLAGRSPNQNVGQEHLFFRTAAPGSTQAGPASPWGVPCCHTGVRASGQS
jgi:hypothetical protein